MLLKPLSFHEFWACLEVICPWAQYTLVQQRTIYDDLSNCFQHQNFIVNSFAVAEAYLPYRDVQELIQTFEFLDFVPKDLTTISADEFFTKAKKAFKDHGYELLGTLDDGTFLVKTPI